jgi:CRP-like cAMP-binding protein
MIAFMRALEPRRYKKDEIILRDLEETEEIIFVLKGEVKTWHDSNKI